MCVCRLTSTMPVYLLNNTTWEHVSSYRVLNISLCLFEKRFCTHHCTVLAQILQNYHILGSPSLSMTLTTVNCLVLLEKKKWESAFTCGDVTCCNESTSINLCRCLLAATQVYASAAAAAGHIPTSEGKFFAHDTLCITLKCCNYCWQVPLLHMQKSNQAFSVYYYAQFTPPSLQCLHL